MKYINHGNKNWTEPAGSIGLTVNWTSARSDSP